MEENISQQNPIQVQPPVQPVENQNQVSKEKRFIFRKIAIFLILIIGFFVFTLKFLAMPYQTVGNPIKPFFLGQHVLAEEITYLFQKPKVGDRVIFERNDLDMVMVGIITKIQEIGNVTNYTIQSSTKSAWVVSKDKIKKKIYYPFLTNEETLKIVSSQLPVSTPLPFQNQTNKIIKLSDAWDLGTKDYSDPQVNLTFKYPSYFEVNKVDIEKKNKEWAEKYKNDPNVEQPLYRSSFSASFSTPDINPPNPDDTDFEKLIGEMCSNKMGVSVAKYNNDQNFSLYDYIAYLNKTYPGDGITQTFETYKKNLKQINIPQNDSYVFEGIIGENPRKEFYFINNKSIYNFSLGGGCNTGEGYSPDANKILENMLSSVKFTDQNQTVSPTSTNSNIKTYTSPLGISFTYSPKQASNEDWKITVKESGNKICVTYDVNDVDCSKGQYVQVFQKSPTDSLETVIKKQFLTNYSPTDCFVLAQNPYSGFSYPASYKTAVISFPESSDPNASPWANADKCPATYTATNGLAYFLEDTAHPAKLLFFSIGQYAIESDNNKSWEQTIKVLN